jgi:hypothetical protein
VNGMNDVVQKPHSAKEAVRSFAKNRVAVISASVAAIEEPIP